MRNILHSFISIRIRKLLPLIFIALLNTAHCLSQTDSYRDSLELVIQKNQEDSSTVAALLDLSFFIIESEPSTSLEYSTRALQISEQIKWDNGIAWSLLNVGLAYDYLANYDTAIIYYRQSFDKRAAMNDRNGMAGALMNAGGSYFYRGIYSLALDYYLKALRLYKSTKNEKGITRCLNNLGAVSRSKKDYQEALKYYMESKKIREKNNDREGMMVVYNNISLLFSYIGNHQASIEYAEKSALIARELNKNVDLANALLNIGMGNLAFNRIEKAEINLHESYELINTTNDQQYKSFILAGMGELFMKKRDFSKSIVYLDSALLLAKNQQRLELMSKCYRLLSTIYEQTGKKDKSLEYYKKFDELSDSLLNQENIRLMNEMNAIYRVGETKKENDQLFIDKNVQTERAKRSLFQRNIFVGLTLIVIVVSILLMRSTRKNIRIRKELSIKNQIIEKSLNEKEILLKEIHHRVKNNLQLVSSLLQLQINRTTEQPIIEALVESQNRIESMSMIHKYLYSHENIGEIDMQVYLIQLANHIEKTYQRPNITVEKKFIISPCYLDLDTAVPLGIIATEIISNSYKYAFNPQNQNILTIILSGDKNQYTLCISDNGSDSKSKKNLAHEHSLGIKLIHLLAKQLRADLRINTENGYKFELTGKQL